MLGHVKQGMLRGLSATGASAALARSKWRRDRLLVLCYHGISLRDEHSWNAGLHLTTEMFEGRMQILADEGYNVLPLPEALDRLRRGCLPEKAVVITFDDGFADFYVRAFAVLRKFGFPATVYLTTYYVLFNRPIFNLIVPYMLWRSRHQLIEPNADLGWMEAPNLDSAQGRNRAWESVRSIAEAQRMSGRAKDDLAAEIADHLNFDYGALRSERLFTLLKPQEVAEISRTGIGVELHTHRHRTPEDPALFTREIEENRRHISELTGMRPEHFCYPSGVHRPDMLPLLKQAGVVSATTCLAGLGSASTDPLLMPRFLDMQTAPELTFKSWLMGTAAILAKLRQ